tara:strand:+ start:428 stop:892 length:465 start_codon:yes stop_codon:yes gene_type:complete
MSKDNYTDTTLINKYKDLVKKPSSDLPLVSVATEEKRTRADLLDILEDLFDSENDLGDGFIEEQVPINTENFRALMHILIKSSSNTSDDSIGLTTAQETAISNNTNKVTQGLSTANHTLDFSVVNSKGAYSLVFTIVDSSGKSPITKTATLALR